MRGPKPAACLNRCAQNAAQGPPMAFVYSVAAQGSFRLASSVHLAGRHGDHAVLHYISSEN